MGVMDADNLATVYTLMDGSRAELIKNFPHSEGIRCFLAGGQVSSLWPGLSPFQIQVQVPAESADQARRLIQRQEDEHR
jgi:hypothetical protein